MKSSIAICGITGAVGQEILTCLKTLNVSFDTLSLYASARSAGQHIDTPFGKKEIEAFSVEKAQKHDFIFLCVSGAFSKEYARELTKAEGVVIDNSSAFRYDEKVPLVVPEINPHAIGGSQLIANPNCTTAILGVALFPLYKAFGLKKVIVSTYQATSGGGVEAMAELEEQTRHYLSGEEVTHSKFQHPIPFNIIPHIDVFQENLYTKEEMKVVWETQKILEMPDLKISCTAVRIPTFRAHAESVTIETEREVTIDSARAILAQASGVCLVDKPEAAEYPMPLTATKSFDVEVGRIRKNQVFDDCGLDFFVCGDQLLKGAALNAVQIMQLIQGGEETL